MTATGVRVEALTHRYGDAPVPALGPIDLTIERGELVALAGPSGCGKTTLLRLLAGFVRPDEGRVLVGGEEIRGPGAERGVVFQAPNLFPWLSVAGNVGLGPKFAGIAPEVRDATVRRHLELVGLADYGRHRPYELSGGMQQRAQIARVLAADPDIVLMDEPFGALDAITRERLQEELLEIWRATGKTILFITHSVDEAVFLGSRVMVMSPRPGRIVLDESAVFGSGERVPVAEIRGLPDYQALCGRVRDALEVRAPAS
ncbi:ABC transporter ATP-binding protein [Nocardioides currus]|uniref:Taurine ABC transporter ATP-binding protein n=1 Tax=Nocardioides currus TaxID=2133958 RepID=A0A2R7YZB2_9ACTN|nr:ABC transporter ATP-binding protein [Nocardioides currus]PUA81654.1 taurine ABC transporter ATP-binding protein [Nocardioides currus]